VTQDQPSQDQPSQDQPSSEGQAPQRSGSFLEDQQTRRLFLKAAVISGAAVAAVGAAGAAAASASPQLLRQIRGEPATASAGCISLAEASKDSNNGPNNFIELTNGDWDLLSNNGANPTPCILITSKTNASYTLLTTVTCNAPKGSAHTLLGICPPIIHGSANTFPAGSCVTIASGCTDPATLDCGKSPC
jgi:hypothetical protein